MFLKSIRKRSDTSNVEVTFISGTGCHLCEVALEVVEDVRQRQPFNLRLVTINLGDEWYDLYHEKIPVVLINGRMAFKYRVDRTEFLTKLRSSIQLPTG